MTRTQIQLPDELYQRAKAFAAEREGVTEFATVNVKGFTGLGFARVWDPLEGEGSR